MAAVMAERVRWQLDGWLTGRTGRLPGALTHLALVPDEVVPDRGRQLGFWGGETETSQRAARALARIQGLLGPEAVHTPRLRGGRDPAARVTSDPPLPDPPASGVPSSGPSVPGAAAAPVPGAPGPPRRGWASAQVPDVPGLPRRIGLAGPLPPGPAGGSGHGQAGTSGIGPAVVPGAVPWPGQVPAPAPAVVYAEPLPAEVVDTTGTTVAVDGRGLLGSLPSRVRVRGRAWSAITAWAGPWLVDERWWDPAAHRRLVRLQATTDQGAAYLLRLAGGHWWVEAIYD
jgi:protein ImuB